MLRDVYERLLLCWLEPRWVADEVHVNVFGRRFMVADRPDGLAVRTLAISLPVTFHNADDVLAAMGLGTLDATG